MESSFRRTSLFSLTATKVVMALALASVLSGLSISPALAQRNDGWDRDRQRGDHQREWRRDGYRPEYRQPYHYAQPVYVPPPVYYEPRQSPGISLFFPLDLRR